jgi:predicted RNase H-like HicB family nuclease
MKYAVIFEVGPTSVGAYVPDLPGCVAVGADIDEARALIVEAIPFHLESMRRHGEEIPIPASLCEYI